MSRISPILTTSSEICAEAGFAAAKASAAQAAVSAVFMVPPSCLFAGIVPGNRRGGEEGPGARRRLGEAGGEDPRIVAAEDLRRVVGGEAGVPERSGEGGKLPVVVEDRAGGQAE